MLAAVSSRSLTPWVWALACAALLAVIGSGCGTSQPTPRRNVTPSAPRTTAPIPASAWQREVERWVGTPYKYGGSDRRGVDCSGFVQQVQLRVAGVRLPRTARDMSRVGRAVNRRDVRPGDLVFFDTTGRGVSHVGVMVGGDRFAHASESRGVVYSRLAEPYWSRQWRGARRMQRRPLRRPARRRTRRANPLTPPKGSQHTFRTGLPVTHP